MKHRWLWYTLALINTALLILFVSRISESTVPIHYNLLGQADRFGSKWWLLIPCGLPLLLLIGYDVYCKLTQNNPRIMANRKYEAKAIPSIAVAFMAISWCTAMFSGETLNARFPSWLAIALGLLMIYLSNFFGKIQPNRTYGLKIWWTLKDDEVWRATHRMASYWGVAGGAIMLLGGILGLKFGIAFPAAGILLGVLILIVPPTIFAHNLYYKRHPKS